MTDVQGERSRDTDMDVADLEQQAQPLVFPASYGQQRLWLVDRLEPGSTSYTMPFLARLSGTLDAGALERALTALVGRHETLRTTFFEAEDDGYQRVSDPEPVPLELVDISDAADPEAAAREVAAHRLAQPFDLAHGPLLRCTLARLGDGEHLLIL